MSVETISIHSYPSHAIGDVPNESTWSRVDVALPHLDTEARLRVADRIGRVVVGSTVDYDPVPTADSIPERAMNLRDGIYGVKRGVQQAVNLVMRNVRTTVAETLFKVGHHTIVPLKFGAEGFEQDGVPLTTVSVNTLKYMQLNGVMRNRTINGELKNAELFNILHETGVLATHDVVVCSLTPEDEETRKDYHFYTDTDSVSIQMLSGSGTEYNLETTFVAGKTSPNGKRHDLDALKLVALENGLDIMDVDVEGMLQIVMMIPKGSLTHGLESFVEQYDNAVGGTFYGEDRRRQNYHQYAQARRAMSFDTLTDRIYNKLISRADVIHTPEDAVRELDYWSRKMCVEEAVLNEDVDARVFGPEAAVHIVQARRDFAAGNLLGMSAQLEQAKSKETGGACPIKLRTKRDGTVGIDDDFIENQESAREEIGGEKEMTCPFCEKKTVGDPCASKIVCKNCSADSSLPAEVNRLRAAQYFAAESAGEAEVKSMSEKLVDDLVMYLRQYDAERSVASLN